MSVRSILISMFLNRLLCYTDPNQPGWAEEISLDVQSPFRVGILSTLLVLLCHFVNKKPLTPFLYGTLKEKPDVPMCRFTIDSRMP